jgi:hypothetical protein
MKKEGGFQLGTVQLGYVHAQGEIGGADFFYHPISGRSWLTAKDYSRKKDLVSTGLF